MPDDTKETTTAVVHTSRIGDAADGISKGITRIGRLEPGQVLAIIACVGMMLTGGLLTYNSYMDREDKKEERRERSENDAAKIREYNAQAELQRQACAAECERNRRESREQLKMLLDHNTLETQRVITAIREAKAPGP